jgi:segregation and condensation protein A
MPESSDTLSLGALGSGAPSDSLLVRLEGFEGPLDLLLDLARTQKVDLAKISILALVEQYLAVIEGARRIRLELAADWLVMAAWLAWLKSRLLLPAGAEAEEAETAADVLAARLRDLQAMRAAAGWLGARPRLGVEVFARGAPEDHTEIDRSRLALDLTSLVRPMCRRRGGRRAGRAPIGRGRSACGACRTRWAGWRGCWGRCRTGAAWTSSCRRRWAIRCSFARRWPAR